MFPIEPCGLETVIIYVQFSLWSRDADGRSKRLRESDTLSQYDSKEYTELKAVHGGFPKTWFVIANTVNDCLLWCLTL